MSNTTATVPAHVHQSKWGFHPCDRETFQKLKELNKLYIQALHQKAAYERWERKEPHNRIMRVKLRDGSGNTVGYGAPQDRPEPPLNGLLIKEDYFPDVDRSGRWLKDKKVKRTRVVWALGAELIGEVYKTARQPHPTSEGVKQMKLAPHIIETLLHMAKS